MAKLTKAQVNYAMGKIMDLGNEKFKAYELSLPEVEELDVAVVLTELFFRKCLALKTDAAAAILEAGEDTRIGDVFTADVVEKYKKACKDRSAKLNLFSEKLNEQYKLFQDRLVLGDAPDLVATLSDFNSTISEG